MKRRYKVLLALAGLLVAAAVAAILVLRSEWLANQVRERAIAEIERATGGTVEIRAFQFDWTRLRVRLSALVLHGAEATGAPPLLRIESVEVGLKIISALKRDIDIAALVLDRPEVRIVVNADGSTNLPTPKVRRPRDKTWVEEFLNLAVREYQVRDGAVEYDRKRIPLDVRGENLRLTMTYEGAGPRYRGELASRVHAKPYALDTALSFSLDREGLTVSKLRLATRNSRAELQGRVENLLAPRGKFDVTATVALREFAGMPGQAAFRGQASATWSHSFDYTLHGEVTAHGLGFQRVANIRARSQAQVTPGRFALRGLTVTALGATFTGRADLEDWARFHAEGRLDGLAMREAARLRTEQPVPWNGFLSGPVRVDGRLVKNGVRDAEVHAELGVSPAGEGTPLEGQLSVAWDQKAGSVQLANSYLATPFTRVDVGGTLGETLQVRARSANLNDLLPVLDVDKLPVVLKGGRASLTGVATGPLDDVHFRGQASLTQFCVEDHPFDRFTGDVEVTRRRLDVRQLALARGPLRVEGQAQLELRDWKLDDGGLQAQLNVRGADLAALAPEFGIRTPVAGIASASVRLWGPARHPLAEISTQVEKPAAFEERFDWLRAELRYSETALDILNAQTEPPLQFKGAFQHAEGDWSNGELHFEASTAGLPLARLASVTRMNPGLEGLLVGKASGAVRFVKGEPQIVTLSGDLAARDLKLAKRALGELTLTAEARGNDLVVRASARLRDVAIDGSGTWRMEGDYPGGGRLQVSRASAATIQQLLALDEFPFDGFLQAAATFTVPLHKLENFRAQVTLPELEIHPKPTLAPQLGAQTQDLVLRNVRPVTVTLTSKEARILDAAFAARNTDLGVSGSVAFNGTTVADLAVKGSINLAILQLFNKDLLARGMATVDAAIRGPLENPQLAGRMELKGASLYVPDVPNGIDNANGVVRFDRRRATIEKLTAQTGGGQLSLGGFIEFGSVLLYRMQARAEQVRVRYPEDVSVTLNAELNLTGTSDNSTVSGVITIMRASFNPRTDLGQLLARSTRPVATPVTQSDYLRGMQFDVRIESGPSLEVQTSLTRDLEAEAELRLRGTPLRPVLLGSVSVNAGEIQVFGNRYAINRGEIRFLNPVKLEPVFDMDLETQARGVTVNISFAGTLQKLNVSYRSDPPLQTRDIVALLAVGRDPTASAGLAAVQTPDTGFLQSGASSLLGQAVNAQLSSRLQRFFGVSRLKIDPQLTGVENLPQARLTLEQQVSKDITLTYITNLNRTQEQIVRVQWDLSRQWSAIAVREGNGVFGIDFQYRKRFK